MISHRYTGSCERDRMAIEARNDNQRPPTAVYTEPSNAELALRSFITWVDKREAISEVLKQRQRDWDSHTGELEQLVKEAREAEAAWRDVCGRLKDTNK